MLYDWNNFYYLIGSAAAGLIGLLFVVVTLTAGFERSQAMHGSSFYMTPTVVNFAVVLSISAAALAPGLSTSTTAILFGLVALVGLAAATRACVGIGRPREGMPPPHWSDFWCYGAAPMAIYAAFVIACIVLLAGASGAADAMAALLVMLLLVGIRNAWDLVTWIAPKRRGGAG